LYGCLSIVHSMITLKRPLSEATSGAVKIILLNYDIFRKYMNMWFTNRLSAIICALCSNKTVDKVAILIFNIFTVNCVCCCHCCCYQNYTFPPPNEIWMNLLHIHGFVSLLISWASTIRCLLTSIRHFFITAKLTYNIP